MMWLTERERLTLSVLGVLALAGFGALAWQERRAPLVIKGSPTAVEAAQWDQALASARQVDVNTATVAELERLPHVGPSLAARIVEEREAHGPFHRREDLSRVKGIGPKMLETLDDYIAVDQ